METKETNLKLVLKALKEAGFLIKKKINFGRVKLKK